MNLFLFVPVKNNLFFLREFIFLKYFWITHFLFPYSYGRLFFLSLCTVLYVSWKPDPSFSFFLFPLPPFPLLPSPQKRRKDGEKGYANKKNSEKNERKRGGEGYFFYEWALLFSFVSPPPKVKSWKGILFECTPIAPDYLWERYVCWHVFEEEWISSYRRHNTLPFPQIQEVLALCISYLQLQQVGSIGARDWVIPMFANAKHQKGERKRHTISQKNTATIS